MHNVANVAPVSSSRRTQAVYRAASPVSSAASVRSVKSAGNVQASASSSASANASSSQNAAASVGPNLPMGLLLSVSQPAASNTTATTDYAAMQNDLRSGNLAAAQQAYLRLQTDLMMTQVPTTATGGGSGLNLTA